MRAAFATPLLDTVQYPADIRALSKDQLRQIADELRQEIQPIEALERV
jgi:deoxyxylulose-5-phosphate synthase